MNVDRAPFEGHLISAGGYLTRVEKAIEDARTEIQKVLAGEEEARAQRAALDLGRAGGLLDLARRETRWAAEWQRKNPQKRKVEPAPTGTDSTSR